MELHLPLDPQEVEYLDNQGVTEQQLTDKLTEVWNIEKLHLKLKASNVVVMTSYHHPTPSHFLSAV